MVSMAWMLYPPLVLDQRLVPDKARIDQKTTVIIDEEAANHERSTDGIEAGSDARMVEQDRECVDRWGITGACFQDKCPTENGAQPESVP